MRRMITKNQLDNEIRVVKKDISTLVDKDGNNRFVEGNLTEVTMDGVTYTYKKWSLSGTHLMFVACGTIASGKKFIGGGDLFKAEIPSWMLEKVQPTMNALISYGSFSAVDSNYSSTQVSIYFDKKTNHILCGVSSESSEFTADANFRIEFDLLID